MNISSPFFFVEQFMKMLQMPLLSGWFCNSFSSVLFKPVAQG